MIGVTKMRHLSRALAGLGLGLVLCTGARADTVRLLDYGFTSYLGPANQQPTWPGVTKVTHAGGTTTIEPDPATVGTPPFRAGIGVGTAAFPTSSDIQFFIELPPVEQPNRISFSTACGTTSCSISPGVEFLLGSFSITNGTFFFDREAEFSFFIDYQWVDGSGAAQDLRLTDTIRYVSTQFFPANTDEQNADFFFFNDNSRLGSMRVYERDAAGQLNTGTVSLFGQINSPLQLTRFGDPTGGAFISASTGLLPNEVPEPGSLALALAGLVGLLLPRSGRTHHRAPQGLPVPA